MQPLKYIKTIGFYIQKAYNICMATKTFNLSLPQDLVKALDERAKDDYSSRSDYVRKAIVNQMRTDEALKTLLDAANSDGARLGIVSEQQVYDIIASKKS